MRCSAGQRQLGARALSLDQVFCSLQIVECGSIVRLQTDRLAEFGDRIRKTARLREHDTEAGVGSGKGRRGAGSACVPAPACRITPPLPRPSSSLFASSEPPRSTKGRADSITMAWRSEAPGATPPGRFCIGLSSAICGRGSLHRRTHGLFVDAAYEVIVASQATLVFRQHGHPGKAIVQSRHRSNESSRRSGYGRQPPAGA
jgi:hypothetical protein